MLNREEAYLQIQLLVTRFGEQIESYRSGDYNETHTRRDYIDPFFRALGWDIDNSQGYAEAYREVIHEDKVNVGGAIKAPDTPSACPVENDFFSWRPKNPKLILKTISFPLTR